MTEAVKAEARSLSLPKNKTGLFAADTLHDAKPSRQPLTNVPILSPQYRANHSTTFVLASSEQNHHQVQQYLLSSQEIQQYYPLDSNAAMLIDTSNASRMTQMGIRNGFRPSTLRHPSFRVMTATAQRNPHGHDTREMLSRGTFTPSHGSVRLRSEIDQINGQLKRHDDSMKTPRTVINREIDPTLHSALSFSTSCRQSSASSGPNPDRAHQRFTSAISHVPTQRSIPENSTTLPPVTIRINTNEAKIDSPDLDQTPVPHAYQIPQQSNIGSESVFLRPPRSASNASASSQRTRSVKSGRQSSQQTSVACPFYVMYLTNLALQQRPPIEQSPTVVSPPGGNQNTPITLQPQPQPQPQARKVPVNSRSSTAYTGARASSRRPLTSPLSIHTYSTMEDDERLTLTTHSTHPKQPSARLNGSARETRSILGDILRTSSLTHT